MENPGKIQDGNISKVQRKTNKKIIIILGIVMFILLLCISSSFAIGRMITVPAPIRDLLGGSVLYKPVIYLYPTEIIDVQVELDYKGELIADYPNFDSEIGGWFVKAYPHGKIINYSDEKEYSYIFWEGKPKEKINWDLSTGFIVEGEKTKEFLQEKLALMGLTPKEYNEFIVYWYPKMQDNKYNLIHFAEEQYTDLAPLEIEPNPNSMLRVFMVFKPLEEIVEIKEQEIEPFNREGFVVVEWGGTEVK